MEHLRTIALAIHVIAGTTALLTGLLNMMARKGGKRHRRAGTVFAWSMYAVAASALILSSLLGSIFFFCLGVFTFYMTWNGQRSAMFRTVDFTPMDILVLMIGTANTVVMVIAGNAILMGLGVLSATLIVQEWLLLIRTRRGWQAPPLAWLRRHIGMIVGSYISTLTAFLSVNFSVGPWPYWLPWALPSMVLVPLMIWWTRKYVKAIPVRRKAVVASALLLVVASSINAQPYIDGGNTRHRFAQLNVGAGLIHLPEKWPGTAQADRILPSRSTARLLIGGTHFWGHADFVVAVPVASWSEGRSGEGVETGARIYPWRIQKDRVRPYAGFAWYHQRTRIGEGVVLERSVLPVQAGITLLKGRTMLEAGMRWSIRDPDTYWITPEHSIQVRSPPLGFTVGMKVMLETTASAEPMHLSGRIHALTDTLAARGRLNNFTVAIGAGTGFFLRSPGRIPDRTPWMDDHRVSDTYLHGSAGYYLHGPDLQFTLSFRQIKDRLEAFGHRHDLHRRSISLEAYHFFADAHGFVPFIGACLSHETIEAVHQAPGSSTIQASAQFVRPGVVAGWDIRPNRIQQFLIRTQLRYIPGLSLPFDEGGRIHADQIEADFIQLVVFPGRFR
jgi:uncharacterized membrane protein